MGAGIGGLLMWSRGDIVFRTLAILLLLAIWGSVSDDTVHEFVRFGLFGVGIGLLVFSVMVLVQALWAAAVRGMLG
jgi:hypothetical protein